MRLKLSVIIFSLFFIIDLSSAECNLRMGVFPYTNPQKIANDYSQIADKLTKDTDCRVTILTAKDYDEFMRKASNLEYDIFVPCATCIVKLIKEKVPVEVIAMGHPPFKGAVLVRVDSPIKSLDQLKGKKIAAVGKHSFGGYLFLKFKLASMGIDMDKENTVLFLGNTDNIILSVLNGKADVGVTRTDVLDEEIYVDAKKQLKVLYESQPILHFPFVVSTKMNKELKNKIKNSLLSYTPPTEKAPLQFIKIIPGNNDDYLRFAKEHNLK